MEFSTTAAIGFAGVSAVALAGAATAAPGDVVRVVSSPVGAPDHATYPLDLAFDGESLFLANIIQAADPESPAAVFAVDPRDGDVLDRFDYTDATGGQTLKQIAWDGASIWAVGPPSIDGGTLVRTQTRARIDLTTRAVSPAYRTAPTSRGMAYDFACGKMWDLAGMVGDQQDQPTGELHLRDLPSGTSAWTIETQSHHDGWYSLAHDGCSLWTVDYPAAELVRLDMATGGELERLAASAFGSIGLTFDGTYLWVSDAKNDELYALEIGPAALSTGSCTPGLDELVCRAPGFPTVGEFPGRVRQKAGAGDPVPGCSVGSARSRPSAAIGLLACVALIAACRRSNQKPARSSSRAGRLSAGAAREVRYAAARILFFLGELDAAAGLIAAIGSGRSAPADRRWPFSGFQQPFVAPTRRQGL